MPPPGPISPTTQRPPLAHSVSLMSSDDAVRTQTPFDSSSLSHSPCTNMRIPALLFMQVKITFDLAAPPLNGTQLPSVSLKEQVPFEIMRRMPVVSEVH